MKPPLALPLLACLPAVLLAASPLDEAREALDNGFPQVALVKLEEAFPSIGSPETPAAEWLLYARALLETGQAEAAVSILQNAPPALDPERSFLLAQAHAANADWREALEFYSRAAGPDSPSANEALVGKARMLANLDRRAEAVETLEPALRWPVSPIRTAALHDLAGYHLDLSHPGPARQVLELAEASTPLEKSRRDLLLARAALLENNPAQAVQLLAPLVPWNASVAVDLVLLHAESLALTGRSAEAENLLEEFIATHPDIPRLDLVFATLEKTYARSNAVSSAELKRWSEEKETTPRQRLAAYHLARLEIRQNNPKAALPLLERLAADPGTEPPTSAIILELAALRLRLGLPDESLSILPPPGDSPQSDFLRGLALARKGRHSEAIPAFLAASRDPASAEAALHNAALCEMLSGLEPPPSLALLAARFPESPRLAAFPLLQALHKARSGDPSAAQSLEKAARSDKPAIADRARLALAEWKYSQLDLPGARLDLQKISTRSGSPAPDALEVFLADDGTPGSEQESISLAKAFLEKFPGSDSAAEVRMKLGELLHRTGNYAAARVELETLARDFPGSENEAPALFLAAKSAARIPSPEAPSDAILLLEQVAAMPGPFAHRARLEQAAIQASLGKFGESNSILDKILSSEPDPDTRAAALMEKGKNLFALSDTDPSSLKAAIDTWRQIPAENPDPAWRNQALTRIGTALEKSGDLNAAIASYHEVFKPAADSPPEYFWFHKAGFAAGRLLEARQDWPEAIRVYELIAASEGPRALEARNRIKKIRLENFLWNSD